MNEILKEIKYLIKTNQLELFIKKIKNLINVDLLEADEKDYDDLTIQDLIEEKERRGEVQAPLFRNALRDEFLRQVIH